MALMEIFFHTIALEPARWTACRVSQSLLDLLPKIAQAGFRSVEIFEPHLREEAQRPAIRAQLQECALKPVILSSYVDLLALPEAELPAAFDALEGTLGYFGFSKVRIFPAPKASPSDAAAVKTFTRRVARLAERLTEFEILLETHDLSLADDPDVLVQVVRDVGAPHVGLLFQPLIFDGKSELEQFAKQRDFIRHVHLQNRNADQKFVPLEQGITPWRDILPQLPEGVNASLEFVPLGICPEEQFDVEATLAQAKEEKAFAEQWR
jgi:sugar phosphate isomerase/epimerase